MLALFGMNHYNGELLCWCWHLACDKTFFWLKPHSCLGVVRMAFKYQPVWQIECLPLLFLKKQASPLAINRLQGRGRPTTACGDKSSSQSNSSVPLVDKALPFQRAPQNSSRQHPRMQKRLNTLPITVLRPVRVPITQTSPMERCKPCRIQPPPA